MTRDNKKQLSLTNRATHVQYAMAWLTAWKQRLLYVCYRVDLRRFRSKWSNRVGISRVPKLRSAGVPPFGTGRCWPLKHLFLYANYHAEFGRSRWNLGQIQRTQNRTLSFGIGHAWPLENSTYHHVGYRAEFDRCWSNGTSVRICDTPENWALCVLSFKVKVIGTDARIDRVPMTSY